MGDPIQQMGPEQAAELAALQQSAGGGYEGQLQQQEQQQALGERERLAGEISGLVLAFVSIAKPILPSLEAIYTPETTGTAAAAVAGVCVKHGWLAGGLLGDWGEEIAAAVVLLPLAMATAQGIKADIAAKKKNDREAPAVLSATVPADMQQPGQKTVIVGAPLPAETAGAEA